MGVTLHSRPGEGTRWRAVRRRQTRRRQLIERHRRLPAAAPQPQPIPVRIGAPRGGPPEGRRAPQGPLVGAAAGHRARAVRLRRLCDLGRLQKRELLRRSRPGPQLPLAPLFALPGGELPIRGAMGADHAGELELHARDPDPDLPAGLPPHVLLLPQDATTGPSGSRRRRARSPTRDLPPPSRAASVSVTPARRAFRSSSRTSTATSGTSRSIFAGLLTYDAIEAFRFPGGVGMGLGTLIFVVNAVFIWAYQLGCHACRHLTGGNLRKFLEGARPPVDLDQPHDTAEQAPPAVRLAVARSRSWPRTSTSTWCPPAAFTDPRIF